MGGQAGGRAARHQQAMDGHTKHIVRRSGGGTGTRGVSREELNSAAHSGPPPPPPHTHTTTTTSLSLTGVDVQDRLVAAGQQRLVVQQLQDHQLRLKLGHRGHQVEPAADHKACRERRAERGARRGGGVGLGVGRGDGRARVSGTYRHCRIAAVQSSGADGEGAPAPGAPAPALPTT